MQYQYKILSMAAPHRMEAVKDTYKGIKVNSGKSNLYISGSCVNGGELVQQLGFQHEFFPTICSFCKVS